MTFSIHFLGANGTPATFHVFAHSREGRIVMASPPGGVADRQGVVDLLVRNGACPEIAGRRIDEAARQHVSWVEV